MKRSTIPLAVVSMALTLTAAHQVRADSCVDLRTNTVYDCSGAPPAAKPVPTPAPMRQNSTSLRDQLRERLADPTTQPSQANAIGERIKSAGDRANNALTSAGLTSDPKERARLRSNYQAAMKDLDKAYDDAAAASPNNRADILALKQQTDANFAGQSDIWNETPKQAEAETPAAPPAPDPNLFTTCGPADKQGVQTCYEVPPSGYACRKTLQQNGDRVWTDDQATCDSTAVLDQRNDYFATVRAQQPKQEFGADAIRKADAIAAMSPQCQAQLNQLLEGADTDDKEKTYMAYGDLRAECDAQIRRLATAAEASLPERKLSSRARLAMDRAMNSDPNRIVDAVGERNAEQPYDVGEVLDFASALLGVVSGLSGTSRGGTTFNTVTRGVSGGGSRGQGSPTVRPTPRPVTPGCTGTYVCSAR